MKARSYLHTYAIVLAGGIGHRFGGDTPKQFLRLAGEFILVRSVRAIAGAGIGVPIRVVSGGRTRNASTWNGFVALAAAPDDVIVVHDAVRPLVPVEVIERAIEPVATGAADSTDTVITSADTLVIVEGDTVAQIPERARYRRGQTPQVFRAEVLERAYLAARCAGDLAATDDCSLVLRYVPGVRMAAVAGDEMNIKITTPIDLVLADRLIQMRTIQTTPEPGSQAPLEGARMLVIGGTNGIGAAIARQAEHAGARVIVEGRSLGLDIRDPDLVVERVATAAACLGGLDHVVLTAAVLQVASVAHSSGADLAEVIGVNVTGTLNVARAVHRHLAATRGSLTVFASSSFTRGRSGYVAYSASKAAVVNIAQGLADEWSDAGIRVNAISPERTATPMRRRAFPNESIEGMLSADEVALAALRLLTSDLTGQVIDVRRSAPAADADAAPLSPADADAAPRRATDEGPSMPALAEADASGDAAIDDGAGGREQPEAGDHRSHAGGRGGASLRIGG